MRVVKMIWNERVNDTSSYSLETEIMLDENSDPVKAGRAAINFISSFQEGMLLESKETTDLRNSGA